MSDLGHILTGSGMIAIGAGTAAAEQDAFAGSTLLVSGVLALIGAEAAEKAAAWRIADIRAMQALLADTAPAISDGFTLGELDESWAILSDALIAHHIRIEAGGDAVGNRAICTFYQESARRRALTWPI